MRFASQHDAAWTRGRRGPARHEPGGPQTETPALPPRWHQTVLYDRWVTGCFQPPGVWQMGRNQPWETLGAFFASTPHQRAMA